MNQNKEPGCWLLRVPIRRSFTPIPNYIMNNDDILEEPPPSYEEATGGPSNSQARPQPPPLPPRTSTAKPSNHTPSDSTPGTASAHPHGHPAQTFTQLLPPSQSAPRQFPPTINLYRESFPGGLQRRYHLGEHQTTPLYGVSVSAGFGALRASLVLHDGPTENHAALATVTYEHYGGRVQVHLPPGAPAPAPAPARAHEPVELQTPSVMTPSFGYFRFRVDVPRGGAAAAAAGPDGTTVAWHKEAYEWRRSNSLAIGGLGGAAQGWQLVRLADELPPGGRTVAGTGPPSGDGHEVVAACTVAVMSLTKLWKFCFLGTGVSGALGERWAVMAVVTGLILWNRETVR